MIRFALLLLMSLAVFSGAKANIEATTQFSLEEQLSPPPVEMVPYGAHYALGNFDTDSKLEIFAFNHPKEYMDIIWGPNRLKNSSARLKRWKKNQHWIDTMRVFELWDDGWASEDRKINIINPDNFCLHVAQTSVADFNSDGIDDVFVSCHGFDSKPFPGEHSYVILSVGSGEFETKRVTQRKSFAHGSTIMDLNNDGHLDIVLIETNGKRTKVLYHGGDSNGNFQQEQTVWQTKHGGYVVEAIDINKDGFAEIIVGGLEYENFATRILWNNGTGEFRKSTTLPKVRGTGAYDFFLVGDQLFVLRIGKNWNGIKLQQIDVKTNKTLIVIENKGKMPRKLQRFVKDGIVSYRDIGADRSDGNFTIVNNRPVWLNAQ